MEKCRTDDSPLRYTSLNTKRRAAINLKRLIIALFPVPFSHLFYPRQFFFRTRLLPQRSSVAVWLAILTLTCPEICRNHESLVLTGVGFTNGWSVGHWWRHVGYATKGRWCGGWRSWGWNGSRMVGQQPPPCHRKLPSLHCHYFLGKIFLHHSALSPKKNW